MSIVLPGVFFLPQAHAADPSKCISFEKNDILRVVRALAIFRPSLIALQMPLSEEDEVFVERCFQRSLLVRSAPRGVFSAAGSVS